MKRFLIPVLTLLGACSNFQASKPTMRTGFYFLTTSSRGIKMQEEGSDQTYYLEKTPFASVDHIYKTALNTGQDNTLCLYFDAKGTKDIESATGEYTHPQIATVIDNKLVYVVANSTKIHTGVMCVILENYTNDQLQATQKAVDSKH